MLRVWVQDYEVVDSEESFEELKHSLDKNWADQKDYRIFIEQSEPFYNSVWSLQDLCHLVIQQEPSSRRQTPHIPSLIPPLPRPAQKLVNTRILSGHKFARLKDGNTLSMARQLRHLLVEMFSKHQLLITPEIYVTLYMSEQWDLKVSSSWKQKINSVKIDMANVGAFKKYFVIWGPEVCLLRGDENIRPYIVLVGLKEVVSITMSIKHYLFGRILQFLKMWVQNRKAFFEQKDEFDRLKGELRSLTFCRRSGVSAITGRDVP